MKRGGWLHKLIARLRGSLHEYVCDGCGEEFWSDDMEGAKKEARRNGFDGLPEAEKRELCDDCFHAVMGHAIDTGLHPHSVYFDRDQPIQPRGTA